MFVGQIGKFIETKIVVVRKIHRASWDNTNIKRYLYILLDANKNILTITTPSNAFNPGEEWTLHGRVKRHKEFKGKPQTHICKWSMESKPQK